MITRKNILGCDIIIDSKTRRIVKSKGYNYYFNKITGYFARWGETFEDDPVVAIGCEIADIEIVSGKCLGKCNFCYKCNNLEDEVKYMDLETFKKVFAVLPVTLTQIAFGITDIYANPDFFKIMKHCRDNGVIPNYTTHGLDVDQKAVEFTAANCGAVAVSIVNKEKSYDAIAAFTAAGMTQVNCHFMLSVESYDRAFKIIDDMKSDPRLSKMNAIVFLQYKDKNPYSKFHSLLSVEKYKKLIDYCNQKGVNYGFDSCSAGIFLESIKGRPDAERLEQCVDSCESLRMSLYVSVDARLFPCSFCEGTDNWEDGIDILEMEDFSDIWHHPRVEIWRKDLIATMKNGCAHCPIYDLSIKK